jgi:polygalacturonase
VYIPDGTSRIRAETSAGGVILKSDMTLHLAPGATLSAIPNGSAVHPGPTTPSTAVSLCGVSADHNRRQGLSIAAADGVVVRRSRFSNTRGTAPESGIDLEPDHGNTVTNLRISECTFVDNAPLGVLATPDSFPTSTRSNVTTARARA